MSKAVDTETIEGTVFELTPMRREPHDSNNVCLRKNRHDVGRYLQMAEEFQGCKMIEVGVDQGGGSSFFLKLFKPEALLAIELSDKPVEIFENFLAEHDTQNCVKV